MMDILHIAMFALMPLMMAAAFFGLRDIVHDLKAAAPALQKKSTVSSKPLEVKVFALAA